MADAQKYLDNLVLTAETAGVPHQADDAFDPAHADGHTDLNLHVLDMLAEPDVEQDPYRQTTGSQA